MCAVGDIHGDLAKAINALKVAGLMDDDSGQPVWTGGNAICVQMGDVLDRGDQEIGACFSKFRVFENGPYYITWFNRCKKHR